MRHKLIHPVNYGVACGCKSSCMNLAIPILNRSIIIYLCMNTTWCNLNQLLNPLKNTFEREDIFFRVERANAISGQRSRSGRLGHQLNELLKVNGAIAVLINAPHHALAGGHGDILPHGAEHAVELLGGDEASKQRAELAPAVLGERNSSKLMDPSPSPSAAAIIAAASSEGQPRERRTDWSSWREM